MLTRLINRLKKPKRGLKPHVRIVAIAKDESAYLPEWIIHHLYFGFNSIHIYVNRTKDNTFELEGMLKQYDGVKFINADNIFCENAPNPQIFAYQQALKTGYQDNVDFILFIDIDEFWTPKNLLSTIHDELKDKDDFDSLSFEWCNKLESCELFTGAIDKLMTVARAPHVKSVVKVSKTLPKLMNPHNVRDLGMTHLLANGEPFECVNEKMAEVSKLELAKPIKSSFILHRIYRSPTEYLANLANLNPAQQYDPKKPIKDNRRYGYVNRRETDSIQFDSAAFDDYKHFVDKEMGKFTPLILVAHKFVLEKYESLIKSIEKADPDALAAIKEAVYGIKNDKLQAAIATLQSSNKQSSNKQSSNQQSSTT